MHGNLVNVLIERKLNKILYLDRQCLAKVPEHLSPVAVTR